MSRFTYKGWTLHEEEVHEPDNRWTWHEAQHEDGRRVILHVSPYHDLTEQRFQYLVDHDFPRAPKGNWLPDELDRLIENADS
jgi:hypothetical protein